MTSREDSKDRREIRWIKEPLDHLGFEKPFRERLLQVWTSVSPSLKCIYQKRFPGPHSALDSLEISCTVLPGSLRPDRGPDKRLENNFNKTRE